MRYWHLTIALIFLVLLLFSRDAALQRAAQIGFIGLAALAVFVPMLVLGIAIGTSAVNNTGRDFFVVVGLAFRTAFGYPEVLTSVACAAIGYDRLSDYAVGRTAERHEALFPLAVSWLLSLAPFTRRFRFDAEPAIETPALLERIDMDERTMMDGDD